MKDTLEKKRMEKVVWMKHTDSVSTGKNEKKTDRKKRDDTGSTVDGIIIKVKPN
jgi:hypothetical protein